VFNAITYQRSNKDTKGSILSAYPAKSVAKFKYMDTRIRNQNYAQEDIKDYTKFEESLLPYMSPKFNLSVSFFKNTQNWSLTPRQDQKV
jgi:hypothetical protein